MKIFFIVAMILIMLIPPLAIFYFDSVSKPMEKSMPTENFTKIEKPSIINTPPEKENIIIQEKEMVEGNHAGMGSQIPKFALKKVSEDNILFKSDFLRDKEIVINFWATWCYLCVSEMEILDQFKAKHNDVIILAILTQDNENNAKNYLEKNGFNNFIVVQDYDQKMENLFGVQGIPRSFLVDKTGTVKKVKIGPFINLSEMEYWYGQY